MNSEVEHPVTNGLHKKWMHADDYMLYMTDDLSGDVEVLASAKADSIYGGTNQYLPVMFSLFEIQAINGTFSLLATASDTARAAPLLIVPTRISTSSFCC